MSKFRVALSGDFVKPDGQPTYPMFDLAPLKDHPQIDMTFVQPVDGAMPAAALEEVDALILLVPKLTPASLPKSGRLAVVARFGVGYDSVGVPALTNAGVPLVINTSFNDNEPIVCRPEEAVSCFLRTGMDVLVLGNHYVADRNATTASREAQALASP